MSGKPVIAMKQLLTLRELAAESGYPISTLYKICAPHGDLPCVLVRLTGRRKGLGIRVRRSDWDDWVRRHTMQPVDTATEESHAIRDLPGADRYIN